MSGEREGRGGGGGGGGGGRPYRGGGGGGGYRNNRKRRYRDDDDDGGRQQRRRHEEPLHVKLRKQILTIAESPLRKVEEDITGIGKTVADNYFDDELQTGFYDLLLQMIVEQPFKIPFIAATVLVANTKKVEVTQEILSRVGKKFQEYLEAGEWREVKLVLRFLGCLQGLFEGEGVFPILEDLFSRAVDLQTASSDDALGLELVKIILFTIPYVMSSSATGLEDMASALLDKTDIIASTPHALEALVDPYPGGGDERPAEAASIISILQKQLQSEAQHGWELSCLPRAWKIPPDEDGSDPLVAATKHALPAITVPNPVNQGPKPMFPELYFSVYADQDIETVPPVTDVASSLLRDSLVDTVNILDFNRLATAKFLIDVDCYFAPGTFVKRATPFDRLKETAGDRSTWKPEDVAVDAVFSQLFMLPTPEHKLVYYHSVLTESCKVAPAAIAPSLGRAIRCLYRYIDSMDMELAYRFMDWFSHHLSNFGFTWKWTEWVDDVELPTLHAKKAFIIGALEKEIRLSFAQRIRGTLPEPYQPLISEAKEKETPDFKYDSEQTSFAKEGQEIMELIRKKAPEDEIQPVIDRIHEQANEQGLADPQVYSTDAYVTSICLIGAKSLSHVLSCIERCKDRLLAIGNGGTHQQEQQKQGSPAARKQIITSVMEYWHEQPGIGINIIDKLLNYTILSPMSVVEWALLEHNERGRVLASAHVYEMLSTTAGKVTTRVRQILAARDQPGLPEPQVRLLDETLQRERAEQASMFRVIEEALTAFADGTKDELVEMDDVEQNEGGGQGPEQALIRAWGERWLRVFRRKFAVEEAFVGEALDTANQNGNGNAEMPDATAEDTVS
ncbi:MAG: Mitochondrial Translation Optimization [Chaenotheca gracillima]|nr:MAG: Mitochondrial Translation Optimization [Chaenotheca gracillima]